MQYDNTNRGALFKNDDKQNDNHPDYKGSINVNGTDLWISAWLKTSEKTGKKFLSLSVKAKEEKAPQKPVKQAAARPVPDAFDDLDSDVPF
jgi:uncharacterized protein (DUF736 family)